MKVYIVTRNVDYEGSENVAVFKTQEAADRFAEKQNALLLNPTDSDIHFDVQEMEMLAEEPLSASERRELEMLLPELAGTKIEEEECKHENWTDHHGVHVCNECEAEYDPRS